MLNPVSHSDYTINVPFTAIRAQGRMIARGYAQEFVAKHYGPQTPWQPLLPEVFADKTFNSGLAIIKKQYFKSIRLVLAHLGELHRLVTFKWIHEFYRIQDLFFLFLEELINLYHLQNPDDVLMETLVVRLKHQHALTSLQVFNKGKDKVAKTLSQIFERLLAAHILEPTAQKVFKIYQTILMMKHMSDIPLVSFYHPSVRCYEWTASDDTVEDTIVTCSLDTTKEIYSKTLAKLKIESSLFCDMIPPTLERLTQSIKKELKGGMVVGLEEKLYLPALEYREHFLKILLPHLCELQTFDIFSASREELMKWGLFFEDWKDLLLKNFGHFKTNARPFIQKQITRLAFYQDNFVINLVVLLANIIVARLQTLPALIEEPEVGRAKPFELLTRSFFEKSHMTKALIEPTGPRETRGGSAKPKSVKKKKVKNTAPEKKGEPAKTHQVQTLFVTPLYSSHPRKIEQMEFVQLTPNLYHRLAHSIYQLSLSRSLDLNPLPLRHVAHCVQQMASLYGVISQGNTRGMNLFTLYGIAIEESARAVEQFFDAHFKEIPSTHDLNVLARSLFSGHAFPQIVSKIHLGTYWYRYFAEESANFEKRFSFVSGREKPIVLNHLFLLATRAKKGDVAQLKRKITKILNKTAHFLSANLPLDAKELDAIPLLKFSQIHMHFDQERATELLEQCERNLLLLHDETAKHKLLQLSVHFKVLRDIFIGCRRAQNFSTYAFWGNRLLWQVQHLMAESLTLLIYLQKGVIETRHEIDYLASKTNLEWQAEDLAPFAGLATKSRYPARDKAAGKGGTLIDELEVLLRYPEINSDFVIQPREGDPWDHLPTQGVKIEQVNKSLVHFTNRALELLSEKIFPALFP